MKNLALLIKKQLKLFSFIAGLFFMAIISFMLLSGYPAQAEAVCCCDDIGDTCRVAGTDVPNADECDECDSTKN